MLVLGLAWSDLEAPSLALNLLSAIVTICFHLLDVDCCFHLLDEDCCFHLWDDDLCPPVLCFTFSLGAAMKLIVQVLVKMQIFLLFFIFFCSIIGGQITCIEK